MREQVLQTYKIIHISLTNIICIIFSYLSELLMRITLLSNKSDPKSCNNTGTGTAENNCARSRSSSLESIGLRTTVVTTLHTGPAKSNTCSITSRISFCHIYKVTGYFNVCHWHYIIQMTKSFCSPSSTISWLF